MSYGHTKTIEVDFAADPDDGRAANDGFDDLVSAVATLTPEDISHLSHSLNAADAWDVEDETAANDCGFLANQF